ncbi:lycopene cyclase domain-containing protein [Hamadaea flava]|uniref:Lycopene cyclase domain-containing protein n=1 Tax=Hamadaea flava TaxID=1742688 RepID=A0ABV8LP14_9ACTN|nr:lycopene cyclase domain-containing protein [Hamadaea flava]MCP2322626.1 lycopene cyclase domain-containing protein [Hamadaea flava]
MDRWQYAAVLAACVVITLPLEVILGARVYRRPARLALTLVPVVLVFAVWDLLAARRGHWWWSPDQVVGVHLAGLPIEELLFFLVVPICAVLTYEVLGSGRETPRGR